VIAAAFHCLPDMSPMFFSFRFVVTDDGGTRVHVPFWPVNRTPARDLLAVVMMGLPTDTPTLHLNLEPAPEVWRISQRASFDVPNPSFRKNRKWRGPPCPITAEQDELTFRLVHFGRLENKVGLLHERGLEAPP
jgi:hypothetical protein